MRSRRQKASLQSLLTAAREMPDITVKRKREKQKSLTATAMLIARPHHRVIRCLEVSGCDLKTTPNFDGSFIIYLKHTNSA